MIDPDMRMVDTMFYPLEVIDFKLVAHLIHIWAEAIGVAIAQNIRVVTGPGYVHLASKGLLGAAIALHTGTYMACNVAAITIAAQKGTIGGF